MDIQIYLAGLSLSNTKRYLEKVGVERSRTVIHDLMQKAGLQPISEAQPNHIALDETAIQVNDERHWLYAAVDGADLDAVLSASVTDPFAEYGITSHVAYWVGATDDVRTGDVRATARAATDALLAARTFVEANGGSALVAAADVVSVEPVDDEEASAVPSPASTSWNESRRYEKRNRYPFGLPDHSPPRLPGGWLPRPNKILYLFSFPEFISYM